MIYSGFREIVRELTEEEYTSLAALPYPLQEAALFPEGIPTHWVCGYGYYGHRLIKDWKDGTFRAVFRIGSSCD